MMKIKFLLILPVVLLSLSVYSQQTLNVTGGGQIIMKENVRMVVDGGVSVSTGSEIKVDTSILSLNAGSLLSNDGTVTNNGTINNAGSNSGEGLFRGNGNYLGSPFVNPAGGVVSPGNSPGCLMFGSGFTNMGVLQIEVDGATTPCVDFDQVQVTGTANLSDTLEVTINYSPSTADVITFLTATSVSGTFDEVTGLPADWILLYDYPVAGQVSLVFMACPMVDTNPVNLTVCPGDTVTFLSTASGVPDPTVQWQESTDGGMIFENMGGETDTVLTFVATEGDNGNQYRAIFTNVCGFDTSDVATLTVHPAEDPSFAYAKDGYCLLDTDPVPVIYGTGGGVFSASAGLMINSATGEIDLSTSTPGGPYSIFYNTNGPCAQLDTFSLYIVDCAPEAALMDSILIDHDPQDFANTDDTLQMKITLTNSQEADYEGIEVSLGNTTGLTLVPGSFKSTPVAVDDSYLASENTLLSVLAASGLLQNDFDDNIPGLNVTAFDNTSAEGGTVMVNADGSFSYDPPMDFTGEDSFDYTITDSDGQMNSGVVKIRVQ